MLQMCFFLWRCSSKADMETVIQPAYGGFPWRCCHLRPPVALALCCCAQCPTCRGVWEKESRTTPSKASHRKKKTTPILFLKLLERSSSQKRARLFHGIMDVMACSLGTSGWTHVDARWVPRSKMKNPLQKASYWKLTSPRSLH